MNIEQLKQEAVRKAYGEYWDNVKNNLTQSNWFKSKEVLGDCANTTIFSKFPNIEWECMDNYHPNYCYYFRPKSLNGIEKNNGWIRIEEDGSNLPDKFCECRVILKSRPDNPFSLMYSPDDKSFENDMAYFKASEISHYYTPFNKEKLPVF